LTVPVKPRDPGRLTTLTQADDDFYSLSVEKREKRKVQLLNNRPIECANAATRDRSHCEFLVTWNAKFRTMKTSSGALRAVATSLCDRHTAPRQSQHQNIWPIIVSVKRSDK
jgi:hypothetical protein